MLKINYNREMDILVIEKENYSDYSDSKELGGYILDLDSNSEFLSLEIIDASQKTPLTRKKLGEIQEAEVEIKKQDEYVKIDLTLTLDNGKSIISSQYPRTAMA